MSTGGGEATDRRPGETLARLAATVAERAGADPATSWTARLLAAGPAACARKFGEEAVETMIAALEDDPGRLAAEAADALYHLLVLCRARGVGLAEIEAELARREGRSGIAEKAGRSG